MSDFYELDGADAAPDDTLNLLMAVWVFCAAIIISFGLLTSFSSQAIAAESAMPVSVSSQQQDTALLPVLLAGMIAHRTNSYAVDNRHDDVEAKVVSIQHYRAQKKLEALKAIKRYDGLMGLDKALRMAR